MDLKEIKQIVELMDKFGLSSFELERAGDKIALRRGSDAPVYPAPSAPAQPATAPAQPGPALSPAPVPAAEPAPPEVPAITSPMVGTFYLSPSPEEPPFVKVGDTVDEETVVCIVEAMKVMNEVKAELSGTITKIVVEDSSPVQYGQPLFEISPG